MLEYTVYVKLTNMKSLNMTSIYLGGEACLSQERCARAGARTAVSGITAARYRCLESG